MTNNPDDAPLPLRLLHRNAEAGFRFNGFLHSHNYFDGEAAFEELLVMVPIRCVLPDGSYRAIQRAFENCIDIDTDDDWVFSAELKFDGGNSRKTVSIGVAQSQPTVDLLHGLTAFITRTVRLQREALTSPSVE